MLKYTDEYLSDLLSACRNLHEIDVLSYKRILITGATGLICSTLVDLLMVLNTQFGMSIQVYAAGRNSEKMNKRFDHWTNRPECHFFEYDALKPVITDEIFDFVIHGASNANPVAYNTQPVETMMCNLYGIHNIFELAREKKAGRVLYISSSEVYGKKNDGTAYGESDYNYLDLLNPRACYPSSKRAAETLCASYKKEYGVDFVIVRPGHVYGPTMTDTDSRASSQFPRDVKAGNDIVMKSAGHQLRSYCYVVDCTSAIMTVLLRGVSGEAYNISNACSVVTIREMAKAFAEASGKKVVFKIATADETASYNLMDNSSLTSTKLEALGWRGQYNLLDGVRRTLNSIVV